MNRRRRHAFICAKCHEGATASFATYVVHEPNPTDMGTRKSFPLLFFVFWMMAAIAVGTFAALFTAYVHVGFKRIFTGHLYVRIEEAFCQMEETG